VDEATAPGEVAGDSGRYVKGGDDATGPVIGDEAGATGPVIVDETETVGDAGIVGEHGVAGDSGRYISTDDALNHIGETVTLTGVVVAIKDLGPKYGKYVLSLDSEKDGEGANISVLDQTAEQLDLEGMLGKKILVTGEIYVNTSQNKAEIGVTDPSQVDYPIDT
jgi:hypothetical protein